MDIGFWAFAAGSIPIWITGILIGYSKGYNDRSRELTVQKAWERINAVPERETLR